MSDADGLLVIQGLGVRYGAVEAVRDVDLGVRTGEIAALLGANGAGKSSVLNSVMGLVPAAGGRVALGGEDLTGRTPEFIVRRGVTLCPEGRRVFANLTVAENLVLGAASRSDPHAVNETRGHMLELFPILAERHRQLAGTLSGGEQQMLGIARAMMSEPRLLLLDEPSLGLAPRVVDTIFELIERLRTRGTTILLVEQNVELALEIADRGYVMASGGIVLDGEPHVLRESGEVAQAYLGAH